MSTPEQVLALARKDIGITEYPPNSNNVKFNTEYYGRAVSGAYPWCVVAIWSWFKHAGASDLFYGGKKTASCGILYHYHQARGQAINGGYRAGDLIFFNFSGKKDLDGKKKKEHIGICEDFDGKYITTIEGNTSKNGSQDNGGAVLRQKRLASKYVVAAYRPNYKEEEEVTKEEFKKLYDEIKADTQALNAGSWSQASRDWAVSKGIFKGDGKGNFKWKDAPTREELCEVMYRYAQAIGKV